MSDTGATSRGSVSVNVSSDAEIQTAMDAAGSDQSSFQFSVEKLNGRNYLEWAQSIKLVIDGKGKLGYLNGEVKKPASTNVAALRKWNSENSMVTAWLTQSMKPSIGRTYLFLKTAKDVWDAVRETYSDEENSSQIFDIKTRLWQMKQGDREVTEYYIEMKALWQELDYLTEEEWDCSKDSVRYKTKLETERVYEFLAGLNRDLDDVRGRILSRRPLPSTREVFSEVRREENRRKVMMKATPAPGVTGSGVSEVSALMSKGQRTGPSSKPPKGRPWCEHCRKPGHFKDSCWDLYGRPADWKSKVNNRNHGYQVSVDQPSDKQQEVKINNSSSEGSFNPEQLEQIFQIYAKLKNSEPSSNVTALSSLAHRGPIIGDDDWQC